ncbi:glycosyltransferase [Paenibacillus sp. FSL H8-0537]|uniref:glycosyltransferase n=1 Tax=Paenibacillus sp. FSL H8-0537 TaxID=2921399 RepID=UPI003101A890
MRISTITPVYNNDKYLEECIQSLLNQTYADMECIFVDDGSSDDSTELLRRYEKNNDKMKVIYKPQNEGITAAYRTAFPLVTGDIICFLDADDVALPQRVELTARAFGEERIGMVYSQMELINARGESFKHPLRLPEYLDSNNFFMQLFRRGFFTGTGLSFRNEPWLRLNREVICSDYDISLQFAERGYRFAYIDQTLTQYRIHSNNTSGQSMRMIQDVVRIQSRYDMNNLENVWLAKGQAPSDIYTTFAIKNYYFDKNFTQAQHWLVRSEEAGGNTETFFYLGLLKHMQNNIESAYNYLERAYLTDPERFHTIHNYAMITAQYKGDIPYALQLAASAKQKQPYYLLIDKNIEALKQGEISSLKMIHFLSDEDAVFNSYFRLIQSSNEA